MDEIDGTQYGWGRRGYAGISHVYIGSPNQRGHGIGSFLGGLFRCVFPFIKKGAKVIGREALRTGVNVAGDMIEKNISLKDSVRDRARESGINLKRKAEDKLDTLMKGSGYKKPRISRAIHSTTKRKPRRISGKKKKKSTAKATGRKKRKHQSRGRKSAKKSSGRRTVADIFA